MKIRIKLPDWWVRKREEEKRRKEIDVKLLYLRNRRKKYLIKTYEPISGWFDNVPYFTLGRIIKWISFMIAPIVLWYVASNILQDSFESQINSSNFTSTSSAQLIQSVPIFTFAMVSFGVMLVIIVWRNITRGMEY